MEIFEENKFNQPMNLGLIISILLFLLGPQILYLAQPSRELTYTASHLLVDGLLFSAFFLVGFIGIFFLLSNLVRAKYVESSLYVLICYFGITLINPVIKDVGADMLGLNPLIDLPVLGLNLLLSLLTFYYFIRNMNYKWVLPIPLVLMTCILVLINNNKIDVAAALGLGETNLIVFSFDGISGPIINDAVIKDAAVSSSLKDFTLFRNTISHSPATYSSIFNEFFGSYNWKEIADTEKDLSQLSDQFIKTKDFDFLETATLYGSYGMFARDTSTVINQMSFLPEQHNTRVLLGTNLISASLCKTGICYFGKYGWLGSYINKVVNTIKGKKQMDAEAAKSRENDFIAMNAMLEKFEKTEKEIGAFLGHFTFSHFPITHNDDCDFSAKYDIHSLEAVEKQTVCIIKIIQKIIITMKNKGLYDESLIIFKSDHGKPFYYYGSNEMRGRKIFENDYWGYDRYRPFLMIKYPKENNHIIKYEDSLTFLSDLSDVYCQYSKVNLNEAALIDNCPSVEHFLDKKYDMKKEDSKFAYIPEFTNNFAFDGHVSKKLPSSFDAIEKLFSTWTTAVQ